MNISKLRIFFYFIPTQKQKKRSCRITVVCLIKENVIIGINGKTKLNLSTLYESQMC